MTAGLHAEEFGRRGVRDYLKKPFDLDDLLRRVASALGQNGTDVGPGGSTGVSPSGNTDATNASSPSRSNGLGKSAAKPWSA